MNIHDQIVELIRSQDPEAATIVQAEADRQASTIELIASENHASEAVMHAGGTCMTNKYAEGYPGRRRQPRKKRQWKYKKKTQNLIQSV